LRVQNVYKTKNQNQYIAQRRQDAEKFKSQVLVAPTRENPVVEELMVFPAKPEGSVPFSASLRAKQALFFV